MKRNKKDQPIIRRPKPLSIIEGISHSTYPDNSNYRIAFMKGAVALANLLSNEQNPKRSVARNDASSNADDKTK